MTTMGKFNLEQPGTIRVASVCEDRGFHSKTFCLDSDKVKESAESRKITPVYQIGSLPLPPTKLRYYLDGGLRVLRERFFHHRWHHWEQLKG